MKKLMLVSMLLAIVALGAYAAGSQEAAPAAASVEKVLTQEELIAAAQAEGKVVVYSITSRISGAAAEFEKKYGIKVEASNLKDGELIEKVTREVGRSEERRVG